MLFIAMRKRLEEREEGFTLIELLVVVIIIGILAAIAIPAFLNQRERAWQAELTSTVRNTALDIEADATAQGGNYSAVITDDATVQAYTTDIQGGALPVTTTFGDSSATSFCIEGTHDTVGGVVLYDSDAGGLQDYDETGTATC